MFILFKSVKIYYFNNYRWIVKYVSQLATTIGPPPVVCTGTNLNCCQMVLLNDLRLTNDCTLIQSGHYLGSTLCFQTRLVITNRSPTLILESCILRRDPPPPPTHTHTPHTHTQHILTHTHSLTHTHTHTHTHTV